MDDEIKKMEAAAMAAYLKDVQNNADMTSQVLIISLTGEQLNCSSLNYLGTYFNNEKFTYIT